MKLLVCLDGSDFSRAVLQPARELAAAANAQVQIVQVVDESHVRGTVGADEVVRWGASVDPWGVVDDAGRLLPSALPTGPTVQPHLAKRTSEGRDQAIGRLDQTVREALAHDLAGFPEGTTTAVLHGRKAGEVIAAYAGEAGFDLIAMATHSRHGLREMWVGSTTSAVVQSGVAPVLVVHPTG